MHVLTIDIETYSTADIKCGVHKYVDADTFEILLFAYAFDDEPVDVVDLKSGREIPDFVKQALYDPMVIKTAYNAAFEITCLRKYFPDMPVHQWECDMILGCYNGYPPGLAAVGMALGLPEEQLKDPKGKALIRYFCLPCKPTKTNGGRTRNLPEHAPDKWAQFIEYNRQDVATERFIRNKLLSDGSRPSSEEHDLWLVDRAINDRGVGIDMDLVRNALKISDEHTGALEAEARRITGLENPNSTAQLRQWLHFNGVETRSIDKAAIAKLLDSDIHPTIKKVLRIRQELGKSSIKKYEAMANTVCKDGRAHDLFQFYGAARTGRWAGRNIQLQNLPRNYIDDLDEARETVKDGDLDFMACLYDDVPDTLSQLIRTALVPAKGNRFIVADFSAIEARVIAWVAGEKWRQEAFAAGEDIYCASASQMFGVPVVKHGINGDLRQKGKIAELALGYGGGIGALKAMGGDKLGLSDPELQDIVDKWRQASPSIPALWSTMQSAAFRCIRSKYTDAQYAVTRGVWFSKTPGGNLVLHLPSRRTLTYVGAHIGQNRFGNESIIYKGLGMLTHKWEDLETYGGKLVENLIQAIARDCLGAAMMRLEAAGYKIVAHIHDEVVIDVPEDFGSYDEVIEIMTKNEPWNSGLLMNADGFVSHYYKKD